MCDSPLTEQPTQKWACVNRGDKTVRRLLTETEIRRIRQEEERLASYRKWADKSQHNVNNTNVNHLVNQCQWQENWKNDNVRRHKESIVTGKPVYTSRPIMTTTAAQVSPVNNNLLFILAIVGIITLMVWIK